MQICLTGIAADEYIVPDRRISPVEKKAAGYTGRSLKTNFSKS